MSAQPGSATFLREAAFGLVVSIAAASLATALGLLLRQEDVIRIVVAGLAAASLLRTLGSTSERTGRVAVVVLWAAVTLAVWLWHPSAAVYVLAQVAMVWLVTPGSKNSVPLKVV